MDLPTLVASRARPRPRASALALLAWLAAAPVSAQEQPPQEAPPPGEAAPASSDAQDAAAAVEAPLFEGPAASYPSVEDVSRLLGAWDRAGGERVQSLDLGTSEGGRVVPALQFGAALGPGEALASRPTVFLLGGADGRSLSGVLATLFTCHDLLSGRAPLDPSLCVIAIPMISPDGLAATLARTSQSGHDARALDEDADGEIDEDGPDDLDGDGALLEMLIEDPRGGWTPASDARFLVPARAGDAPRYLRVPEGRDDDGDGRYNEDGPGGVVIDRNFPVDWRGPRRDPASGSLPLDAPQARAIAELMRARQTALVLVLQGNHGGLRWYGRDQAPGLEERVRGCFERQCQRAPAGEALLAGQAGGSIGAWASEALGSLALEIAAWGPIDASVAPFGAGADGASPDAGRAPGIERERRAPCESDRAWARWLDDQRGGLGFRNWQAVELGPDRRALVGGWEARTYLDPPEELLEARMQAVAPFAASLIGGMPSLEIQVRALEQAAGLTRLRVELANRGALPTGQWRRSRCRLELVLPAGAELLAGQLVVSLDCLLGGASSEPVDWLVRRPAGSELTLLASAPWAAGVRTEVR